MLQFLFLVCSWALGTKIVGHCNCTSVLLSLPLFQVQNWTKIDFEFLVSFILERCDCDVRVGTLCFCNLASSLMHVDGWSFSGVWSTQRSCGVDNSVDYCLDLKCADWELSDGSGPPTTPLLTGSYTMGVIVCRWLGCDSWDWRRSD